MKKITLLFAILTATLGYSQELLTNGDFETGNISPWVGNAANLVTESGNSYNSANVDTAGDPWAVNLAQVISITNGETYTLTFDAWSDTSRTMIVGIGLNEDPWTNATETVNLTTTSQQFTLTLTANFGLANSRVLFDMGADVGFVGIDNVSLVVVTATCSDGIQNGDETGIDCGGSCANACAGTPTTAAVTPPTRNSWDVVSLYSDAYTDVSSNFDAGWCGATSVTEVMIASNNTQQYLGNACQGIDFSANRVDATGFTHVHIDFFTSETDLTSKVFNLKLVDFGNSGGTSEIAYVEVPINTATTPAIVTGSWVSVDVAVDLSTFTGLAQAAITSNLNNNVWYDNFYVYRAATASIDKNNLVNVSLYPNPVANALNISSENNIENAVIYNILGKQVKSFTINKNEASIDISNLNTGIYILKYLVNNTIGTQKFVKQ